ncbi:hypothetical protein HDV05_001389 [Chytridiales sp. JEL 0842]|nr:hypothetical protein HDV05_001389 [Chytridiales sp. JEL 0842]
MTAAAYKKITDNSAAIRPSAEIDRMEQGEPSSSSSQRSASEGSSSRPQPNGQGSSSHLQDSPLDDADANDGEPNSIETEPMLPRADQNYIPSADNTEEVDNFSILPELNIDDRLTAFFRGSNTTSRPIPSLPV